MFRGDLAWRWLAGGVFAFLAVLPFVQLTVENTWSPPGRAARTLALYFSGLATAAVGIFLIGTRFGRMRLTGLGFLIAGGVILGVLTFLDILVLGPLLIATVAAVLGRRREHPQARVH